MVTAGPPVGVGGVTLGVVVVTLEGPFERPQTLL